MCWLHYEECYTLKSVLCRLRLRSSTYIYSRVLVAGLRLVRINSDLFGQLLHGSFNVFLECGIDRSERCMPVAFQEIARAFGISIFFWQTRWIPWDEFKFKASMLHQPSENNKKPMRVRVTYPSRSHYSFVVGLMLILCSSLPDSNLFAIVTLWPNKQ